MGDPAKDLRALIDYLEEREIFRNAQIGEMQSTSEHTEHITLANGAGAAGIMSWKNRTNGAVLIKRLAIEITAAATTATADAGLDATGTGSSSTIIQHQSIAALGIVDNIKNTGTSITPTVRIPSGQYVTISVFAGLIGSFAGICHLTYVAAA